MTVTIKSKKTEGTIPAVGKALGTNASVTLIKSDVTDGETQLVSSNGLTSEDAFSKYYTGGAAAPSAVTILAPPYDLNHLMELVQQNNTLGQLVTAMEVNVDGTGYEIEGAESGDAKLPDEDKVAKGVKEFFKEVYPGQSFIKLRRAIRRDEESCGNGYAEVLRTVSNKIAFMRHIEGHTVRLVKLGDPILTDVTVTRFGDEHTYTVAKRDRRYVQIVGSKLVYFKEYGVERDLNAHTGVWAKDGEIIEPKDRATELLHFTPTIDNNSPYGLPRWISQIPSVLGSRKAEELNLDFFNSGGLPPAMFIVEGGELTDPVRAQINSYLVGTGASKNRAAIVEVASTGGTLDSPGNVKVKVERFGTEKQKDSMFENYDAKCEERTRGAFRLPPIFVGKAQDYNFATAVASYTVAEAQVFKPERDEFDGYINITVMRDLAPGYTFRSLQLKVQDADQQLAGLAAVAGVVDTESAIDTVNEVVGLNLRKSDEATGGLVPPNTNNTTQEPEPGEPGDGTDGKSVQKADAMELIHLSKAWATEILTKESVSADVVEQVNALPSGQKELFDAYVTMNLMSGMEYDFEGTQELTTAATGIMLKHEATCGCK